MLVFIFIFVLDYVLNDLFDILDTPPSFSRSNAMYPDNTEWISKLYVKTISNMKFKKGLLMLSQFNNWLKSIGGLINFSWYHFPFCFLYLTSSIGLLLFYKKCMMKICIVLSSMQRKSIYQDRKNTTKIILPHIVNAYVNQICMTWNT